MSYNKGIRRGPDLKSNGELRAKYITEPMQASRELRYDEDEPGKSGDGTQEETSELAFEEKSNKGRHELNFMSQTIMKSCRRLTLAQDKVFF